MLASQIVSTAMAELALNIIHCVYRHVQIEKLKWSGRIRLQSPPTNACIAILRLAKMVNGVSSAKRTHMGKLIMITYNDTSVSKHRLLYSSYSCLYLRDANKYVRRDTRHMMR